MQVDTSRESLDEMLYQARYCPTLTDADWQEWRATLRALVAERDALVRDNATLVEGITAANNACCAAEAIIAAAPKGGSDGE